MEYLELLGLSVDWPSKSFVLSSVSPNTLNEILKIGNLKIAKITFTYKSPVLGNENSHSNGCTEFWVVGWTIDSFGAYRTRCEAGLHVRTKNWVSWFPGFLVSWFLVSWFLGVLVSLFLRLFFSCLFGFLVSWFLDFKVSWFQSSKDLPNFRSMCSGIY